MAMFGLTPEDPRRRARREAYKSLYGTGWKSIEKSTEMYKASGSSLDLTSWMRTQIGSKTKEILGVTTPSPLPTPVMSDEIQSAKSKVRRRKKGRSRNILAGRRRSILRTGSMTGSRQVLNTRLGE